MKQLWSILIISFLILFVVGGGCGWSGYKTLTGLLNNRLSTSLLSKRTFTWCFNGLPFIDKLSNILDNKRYVVLLQNNMELRPSGGFMGSYAVLSTNNSGISDIQFQDIYVPDGQLVGHVDPPLPIEQAFGQGWWKLRDSNWDPDFQIAGEQIAWFFDQGHEKVDGLVAINLGLTTEILKIVGSVQPLDYPETVTDKNLYPLAQQYADHNSFAGSTQKKDYLGSVGRAILLKIKQAGPKQLLFLGKLLFTNLKSGQILLWFEEPLLEQVASTRNWTGELNFEASNFIYIVETNLGANKANCCVSRKVNQQINNNENKLQISWENTSEFANPVKPLFWGGNYNDYVRVIIPKEANITEVIVNQKKLILKDLDNQYLIQEDRYQIEQRDKYQILGFWAWVGAGKTIVATVNYDLPTTNSLIIKRQPGIDQFDYQLIVDGKELYRGQISKDTQLNF